MALRCVSTALMCGSKDSERNTIPARSRGDF